MLRNSLILLELQIFHSKSDTLFCRVNAFDLNGNYISDRQRLGRMTDELIRYFRNVHKAVLVDTYIDKRAEIYDVAHGALHYHARFQIGYFE